MNNPQTKVFLRDRFFGALAALAIRHKVLVFVVVGVLTVASSITVPFLKVRTTRQGMTQENLPEQIRFNKYMENFGTPTQLVVLLEGDSGRVKAAADEIAASLIMNKEWVRNVFYRLDVSALEKSGIYYLKMEDLEKVQAFFLEHRMWLAELLSSNSLAEALDRVKKFPGASAMASGDLESVFPFLDALLAQWVSFLEKPGGKTFELIPQAFADKLAAEVGGEMTNGGYILGRDGKSALLFVQQSKNIDDTSFTVPFMAYCRRSVAHALKKHPGVTAGFTGWPVAIEEEIGMLKRDLSIESIGSAIGILLLLFFSFRSFLKTMYVFVPLVFGVIWNIGATYLAVGHLNYVTSVFFGLLFSLGTEYGIVFIRRYSEERVRGREKEEAITRTFHAVGPGIMTSSLTTVAAFIAIGVSGVPAFSEMGIVAGMGMFCLVVATLVILPPLLLLFGLRYGEDLENKIVGSKTINRIWGHMGKTPGLVLVLGAAVTVIAVSLLPKLTFDYSIDNLLPANSETLAVSRKLDKLTGYKSQYLVLTADNLDQVRKIHALLDKKPTVESVESLARIIPADQEHKQKLIASLSGIFEGLPSMNAAGVADVAALRAKLSSLVSALEKNEEDAFAGGRTKLVGHLEILIGRFSGIVKLLDSPDASVRETAFESALAKSFSEFKDRLAPMLAASPVTVDSLPNDLKERFVGKDGRFAVMVFPKEQIWDLEFLKNFVTDVRDAAAQVLGEREAVDRTTGFGAVYLVTSKMITNGFRKALLITFVMVAVLLLIDFKRIRDAVLASVPFLVGIAWTLAAFVIMGSGLNMASQIALPVLIGMGVDFGVHTVHRWREPDGADLSMVVSTIGGSLWLAGGTNLIGFGLLLLADYRGLTSFGVILFVGIFICFTSAMFGLPSVIKALRLDRGHGIQNCERQ